MVHALAAVDPGLRRALETTGAGSARGLAYLTDGSWEDALATAAGLAKAAALVPAPDGEAADELTMTLWAGELLSLQQVARGEASCVGRHFAARAPEELAAQAAVMFRGEGARFVAAVEAETRKRALTVAPPLSATRARRGPLPPAGVDPGAPDARARTEEAQRQQQLEVLEGLLREAEAPIVQVAAASAHPERVLAAAAGGRRARTLAKWLGTWRNYRAWLVEATGRVFPAQQEDLIDYLVMRADEPCGRSTLHTLRGLFQVMEEMAGVPLAGRLSRMPAVLQVADDLMAAVPQRVTKGHGEAPRYVRAHLVAFEAVVRDEGAPAYLRLYAWWKLVSIWGVLRFDDHRGAGPANLRLGPRGLEGRLERTKTTGPDKKVAVRPMLVTHGAYVADPSWLARGWALWQQLAPEPRDYFLLPPLAGFDGVEHREATYPQAAIATRALHRYLRQLVVALCCPRPRPPAIGPSTRRGTTCRARQGSWGWSKSGSTGWAAGHQPGAGRTFARSRLVPRSSRRRSRAPCANRAATSSWTRPRSGARCPPILRPGEPARRSGRSGGAAPERCGRGARCGRRVG